MLPVCCYFNNSNLIVKALKRDGSYVSLGPSWFDTNTIWHASPVPYDYYKELFTHLKPTKKSKKRVSDAKKGGGFAFNNNPKNPPPPPPSALL